MKNWKEILFLCLWENVKNLMMEETPASPPTSPLSPPTSPHSSSPSFTLSAMDSTENVNFGKC